jgi:hypothetical protein
LVALSVAFGLVSVLRAQGPVDKLIPVTQKDLNDPDPADWLMLGGNMGHWNYWRLDQINRGDISGLQLVWARQLPRLVRKLNAFLTPPIFGIERRLRDMQMRRRSGPSHFGGRS